VTYVPDVGGDFMTVADNPSRVIGSSPYALFLLEERGSGWALDAVRAHDMGSGPLATGDDWVYYQGIGSELIAFRLSSFAVGPPRGPFRTNGTIGLSMAIHGASLFIAGHNYTAGRILAYNASEIQSSSDPDSVSPTVVLESRSPFRALSVQGSVLYAADEQGWVHLLDLTSRNPVPLMNHSLGGGAVTGMDVKGALLAATALVGSAYVLRVFDLTRWALIHEEGLSPSFSAAGVAIGEGHIFATWSRTGGDRTVGVWEVSAGGASVTKVREFVLSGPGEAIDTVGKRLLSLGHMNLAIVSTETGPVILSNPFAPAVAVFLTGLALFAWVYVRKRKGTPAVFTEHGPQR